MIHPLLPSVSMRTSLLLLWLAKLARRNGLLDDIHSIDDRYDHDIDELMA
jgi:hypothetical protein